MSTIQIKMIGGAVLVASLLSAGGALSDDVRKQVMFNDKMPNVSEIEGTLFPDGIKKGAEECKALVDAGLKCGSVIPKASMETTLVTFERGSANLTDQSKLFLDRVGTALKNRKDSFVNVVVEGHTDATGSKDGNRTLSKKRAESVKAYLSANYGISNVETVGRASDMLKDKANPAAAINRRIEFVVSLPGQEKAPSQQ